MTRPRVTILDVGHGVCAVLRDASGTVMFDLPSGEIPRKFLRQEGVRELDAIFISHHHDDHNGGVSGFYGEDYAATRIFCNAPRKHETKAFERMMRALRDARNKTAAPRVLHFERDTETSMLDRGLVQLVIVGPDSVDARLTRELDGRRRIQTDHSLCGVARIDYDGKQRVLLTGDLNDRGLSQLIERYPGSLKADVLVYPHHGGASDVADERVFAEELGAQVQPKLVVFSLARTAGERPHPEVLEGLRNSVSAECRLVCTQLSKRCDERDDLPLPEAGDLPLAAGASGTANHCCAGTIEICLDEPDPVFTSLLEHKRFLDTVQTPQCRSNGSEATDDVAEEQDRAL